MRTYVYAGVHACIYVCMSGKLSVPCVCVRACIRANGRECMHVCMYEWLVSCLSVWSMCVRAYVRACLRLSVLYVCLAFRHMHVCMRVCLSVCASVHACLPACLSVVCLSRLP